MMKQLLTVIGLTCTIALSGCQSTYYSAVEKVTGQHKRDILVSRVESTNEAQQEAQQEFKDALTQLSELINFNGGKLAEQYDASKAHYEDSLAAAEDVRGRIDGIENVADALFDEWQEEIDQFTNAKLKSQSQGQLRQTQRRYNSVIKAMHKAESRMQPVLDALKDNVLFLKHNLNAQAIGALQGEYQSIKNDVELLIGEMNKAIEQSNAFIAQLKE